MGREGLRGGIGAPHLWGGGAWLPFILMPALTDPNPASALKVKPKECLGCIAPRITAFRSGQFLSACYTAVFALIALGSFPKCLVSTSRPASVSLHPALQGGHSV